METSVFEIFTLRYIPELLAWAIGIILAVIMVRRGGGKAEKLLLAGCCLIFVPRLGSLFIIYHNIAGSMGWVNWLSIPVAVLALAGLICLIWAFLTRFRTKKPEAA
jgi:hypothetical protein